MVFLILRRMSAFILLAAFSYSPVAFSGLLLGPGDDIIKVVGANNGSISNIEKSADTNVNMNNDDVQQGEQNLNFFVFDTVFQTLGPLDIQITVRNTEADNSGKTTSEYWTTLSGEKMKVTNSTNKQWFGFDLFLGFYVDDPANPGRKVFQQSGLDLLDFDTNACPPGFEPVCPNTEKSPGVPGQIGDLFLSPSDWKSDSISWKNSDKDDTGIGINETFSLETIPIDIPNYIFQRMPEDARVCLGGVCDGDNPDVIGYNFILRMQPYAVPAPQTFALILLGLLIHGLILRTKQI